MNKQIKIICCIPGRTFSNNFLKCWTSLINDCYKNNIQLMLSCAYDSNVNFVRSKCLVGHVLRGKHQKPFDNKLDYDYILWIDSDMTFKSNDLFRLINLNKDVCSGLYLMDGGKYFACVKNMDNEYFKENGHFEFLKKEEIDQDSLPFIADYVGLGFCLIKKNIIEQLEYPWFEPKIFDFGVIREFTSEDVAFALKLKEKNIKIIVDPSVVLGHEKTIIY